MITGVVDAQPSLAAVVGQYGKQVKNKLGSVTAGQPEDQLRAPLEGLLTGLCGLTDREVDKLSMIGEATLSALSVRPDYAVEYDGALVGFIEVKAPGKGSDPRSFGPGHDREQWKKLQALPNLLYTDGQSFTLWRSGDKYGATQTLEGDLATAGAALAAPTTFLQVVRDFLSWKPISPESPAALATVSARLCQLLRDEVREQIEVGNKQLVDLRDDWKTLLFPEATDAQFADWYAQAVTFGLLLARARGIDLRPGVEHAARQLSISTKSLIGSALRILVDDPNSEQTLQTSVATMGRVLAEVDWNKVSQGDPDAWLYFYEGFLQTYDTKLRKATGSYYTPPEVTAAITRLTKEILATHLNLPAGFADPSVTALDPALGSGTFLLEVIRTIAEHVADEQGPGAVPPALQDSLSRLIGFELQLGPFAVSQLRLLAELTEYRVSAVDPQTLRTYVTNTLDDPFVEETQLGSWYKPITEARRAANQVKAEEQVLVVLGNPPYKEKSRGAGGWIEHGAEGYGIPMDHFMPEPGWNVGTHTKHLYNAYVYFWRWATWKVFDSTPNSARGVVAFITVAGFLHGPGFQGMRRYLRQTCDDIWVINCTPEGFRPPVNTRIFEAMRHEVCITFAVRSRAADIETPARVHYRELMPGRRTQKFAELQQVSLDGDSWHHCSTGWRDPFLPKATDQWASYLSLDDVFLYDGSGVMPGRTWIIDPDSDILAARWDALIQQSDREQKRVLFKEHKTDRTIDKVLKDALPGFPVRSTPVATETGPCPTPIRLAFRSFDRRWIIPDKRLINRPNPNLWAGRSERQVWLTAPSRETPAGGPALTGCALIPDLHHYNGRGGRTYPLWQNASATVSNVNPKLITFLSTAYKSDLSAADVVAYVAGICAHPGYTTRFAADLKTPGLRVPWTQDCALFARLSDIGAEVLWLHTYGQSYVDPANQRLNSVPRLPTEQRPQVPAGASIPSTTEQMPETISHDADTQTLHIGAGQITNVTSEMWNYRVSGVQVVREWFNDRKKDRTPTVIGDRGVSPLWKIHSNHWRASYTEQLLDLLNVLGRLILLEPDQNEVLDAVVAGPLWSVEELTAAEILPVASELRTVQSDPLHSDSDTLFDVH